MQNLEIKRQVRQYIVENFMLDREHGEALGDRTSFLSQGILDSTSVLELVSFLEERFGIEVADDEIVPTHLDSLEAITAYVAGKLAGSGAGAAASA